MSEDKKPEKSHEGLQSRLRNCLQTIIELEPTLMKLDLGEPLLREFRLLRSFITRLDQLEIAEADVLRIEAATNRFLDELKTPFAELDGHYLQNRVMH